MLLTQNKNLSLLQDIYAEHLEKINSVRFTRREIDIIACIICGRTSKKIASFLSISSKTVDNHKHNIMVKLGCNARDGIIDFIEKSNKMVSLRRYYSSLLAQAAFEKQLKEISVLVPKEFPLVFIVCQQKKGNKLALLEPLTRHLKLAGIKAVLNTTDNIAYFYEVTKNIKSKQASHIITMMPDELIKKLQPDIAETFKGLELIQENPRAPLSILFLSLEKDISNTINNRRDIFFLDKQNYYLSVFELLQSLLPTLNFDKIIADFRQQQDIPSEDSAKTLKQISSGKDDTPQPKATHKNLGFSILKNEKFLLSFLLFSISVLPLLFISLRSYISEIRDHQGNLSIRSDLVIPADSSLLNRPALLAQIHEKLHAQGKPGIETVALVGVGGAGKSILARQYACHQKNSVVWEVNAETKESLVASFEALAYALSKTDEEKKELRTILESKNTLKKENQFFVFLKKQLRSHPNWLLIYDNIDTFNSIQDYFPHDATVWGKGHVIITTQDANIKNTSYINSAHIVNVEGLNNEERRSLFIKIMNLKNSQHAVASTENLLREIPPFPLDVSTAAYFLKETKIPYEQYVERMTTQSESFATAQKDTLHDVGKYNKTRYGIIALSLKNIIDKNKDFQNLLWLIELIGSENIPQELLEFYKGDSLVYSFIHELKRSSLILEKGLPPANSITTFSIHRSIHKIISSYLMESLSLETKAALMREAVQVLEKYLIHILDKEDVEKIKIFSPHLEQFLTHAPLIPPTEISSLNDALGSLYYYQGFYDKANKALNNNHQELNQFHDTYSLQLANISGVVYKMMGQYKKAKDVFQHNLALYTKYYSDDYDNIAWTLACLGSLYKKLGYYKDAKTVLERSILIYKQNYTNHPDSEWALMILANVYRDLGESDKATPLLEDALKINKTRLEREGADAGLLNSLIHLGTAYRRRGDYEKAKTILEETLKRHQELFGEASLRTARASFHLAKLYRDMGNYKKADSLFRQSLAIYETLYGKDHIQVGRILRSLGHNYFLQGLLETAEAHWRQALDIFQQVHHAEAFRCLENLANVYLKKASLEINKGNNEQSKVLKRQAIDALKKSLENVKVHFPEMSSHKIRLQNKIKSLESSDNIPDIPSWEKQSDGLDVKIGTPMKELG